MIPPSINLPSSLPLPSLPTNPRSAQEANLVFAKFCLSSTMLASNLLGLIGIEDDGCIASHMIQTLIMKATGAIRTFEVDQQVMTHVSRMLEYFSHLIKTNMFTPLMMLPNDYLLYHLPGNVQSITLNSALFRLNEHNDTDAITDVDADADDGVGQLGVSALGSQGAAIPPSATKSEHVRCHNCKELMSIPIIVYPCQHVVCAICIEKNVSSIYQSTLACPSCYKDIILTLVDAGSLEAAQKKIITRCPYADTGCTFSDTLFKLYNDHIILCPNRLLQTGEAKESLQKHMFLAVIATNDERLSNLVLNSVPYNTVSTTLRECIQDQLVIERQRDHYDVSISSQPLEFLHRGSTRSAPQSTRSGPNNAESETMVMMSKLLQLSFHSKTDQDYILNSMNESNETLLQIKHFISELTKIMARFLKGKAICMNCKNMFEEAPLSVAALNMLDSTCSESRVSGTPGDSGVHKESKDGKVDGIKYSAELPAVYEKLLERIDALEKEVIQKSEQLQETQRTLEQTSRHSAAGVSASTYIALQNENEQLRAEIQRLTNSSGTPKLGNTTIQQQLDNSNNNNNNSNSIITASGITSALMTANYVSGQSANVLSSEAEAEMRKKDSNIAALLSDMEAKQDSMQHTIAELQKSNIILMAENRKLTDKNHTLTETVERLRQERDVLYKQSEKASGLTVEEFRKVYMEYQVLKEKLNKLSKEYIALADIAAKAGQSQDQGDSIGQTEQAEQVHGEHVMSNISTISLIRYILNPLPLPNSSSTLSLFANESRRRIKIGVNHAEDKDKRLRAFMELFGMLRRFYMLDFKRIRIDDFLSGFEVEGIPQGEAYSIAARVELMNTVRQLTRENGELLAKLANQIPTE